MYTLIWFLFVHYRFHPCEHFKASKVVTQKLDSPVVLILYAYIVVLWVSMVHGTEITLSSKSCSVFRFYVNFEFRKILHPSFYGSYITRLDPMLLGIKSQPVWDFILHS